MKDINAERSIVPLGEFKAKAASFLKALDDPLIVTQNGRAAAVVLSPALFEEMRDRNRFLEAVAVGLSDAESGRVVENAGVKAWLETWGNPDEAEPPQCE